MICIAITGGIGSGKSYVSALLEKAGIPVYNADNESKRLTTENAEIRCGLVNLALPARIVSSCPWYTEMVFFIFSS